MSDEAIKKAIKKNEERNGNISFVETDVYKMENYLDVNKYGNENIFDVITIGQALHWFKEEEIFPFLNRVLATDGTVGVFGYKKQHFKEGEALYQPFENLYQLLKPYFECDTDNNDNNYYKFDFNKYFGNFELKLFEEETTISLSKLFSFLKSWSAYYNYQKATSKDPLETFIKECREALPGHDENVSDIKYYNFYFAIILHKKV